MLGVLSGVCADDGEGDGDGVWSGGLDARPLATSAVLLPCETRRKLLARVTMRLLVLDGSVS
jgi:hypothetical protein